MRLQPFLLLLLASTSCSAAWLPRRFRWTGHVAAPYQSIRHSVGSPDLLLSQAHSHVAQKLPIGPLSAPEETLGASTSTSADPVSLTDPRVATVFGPHSSVLLPRIADEAPGPDIDMELAKLAGRLTSAAYCGVPSIAAWNCSRCSAVGHNMQVASVIFDAAWDLTAYVGYLPDDNIITVSFKGTDSSSIANWMRNLQSWRLDKAYPMPEAPHALIHIGFYNMWHFSQLEANVTAAVAQLLAQHADAHLLVTGHSMGGALAQLCALDMKFGNKGLKSVRVVTFGSPRVGNQAYADLFTDQMDKSLRFTHNRDIVPSLPPLIVGFRHVAQEAWLVDVESEAGSVDYKVLVCDTSGEDPSCHNSACYLGICTSIADHLVYLDMHMYRDIDEC